MSAERKAGMIMGWARHATRTIGRLALLLVPALSSASAEPADNLWTAERKLAVTRIEVPQERGAGPSVGSGFVVKGMGGRYFILTSTHVVLPEYDAAQALPSECLPLLNGTRLFQGNSGGAELRPRCVRHLGSDISLVELEPRDAGYPALVPSPRDLAVNDVLSLAGFPLGYPRDIRSGKVTLTSGPDGTVLTDILTAEGMSGGPYLAPDGMVVGIHRGGGRYTAGYAHMMPIWRLRTSLESFLPVISELPGMPGTTAITANTNPTRDPIPRPLPGYARARPTLTLGERTILYDAFQKFEASAFSFRSRRVVSMGDLSGDFAVANTKPPAPREPEPSLFLFYDAEPYRDPRQARAGIAEAPVQNLLNADECPSVHIYQYHWFKPQRNKVYCMRSRDGGSYAKIKVEDLESDLISFDWIHQPGLQD